MRWGARTALEQVFASIRRVDARVREAGNSLVAWLDTLASEAGFQVRTDSDGGTTTVGPLRGCSEEEWTRLPAADKTRITNQMVAFWLGMCERRAVKGALSGKPLQFSLAQARAWQAEEDALPPVQLGGADQCRDQVPGYLKARAQADAAVYCDCGALAGLQLEWSRQHLGGSVSPAVEVAARHASAWRRVTAMADLPLEAREAAYREAAIWEFLALPPTRKLGARKSADELVTDGVAFSPQAARQMSLARVIDVRNQWQRAVNGLAIDGCADPEVQDQLDAWDREVKAKRRAAPASGKKGGKKDDGDTDGDQRPRKRIQTEVGVGAAAHDDDNDDEVKEDTEFNDHDNDAADNVDDNDDNDDNDDDKTGPSKKRKEFVVLDSDRGRALAACFTRFVGVDPNKLVRGALVGGVCCTC